MSIEIDIYNALRDKISQEYETRGSHYVEFQDRYDEYSGYKIGFSFGMAMENGGGIRISVRYPHKDHFKGKIEFYGYVVWGDSQELEICDENFQALNTMLDYYHLPVSFYLVDKTDYRYSYVEKFDLCFESYVNTAFYSDKTNELLKLYDNININNYVYYIQDLFENILLLISYTKQHFRLYTTY